MTKRILNQVVAVVGALAVCAAYAACGLCGRARSAEAAARRGRYSPAQVLCMASRLSLRVAPETDTALIEAHYDHFADASARPVRIWTAQCSGSAGRDITFAWDADSGRLVTASGTIYPEACSARAMGRRQAAGRATGWLRELELGDPPAPWRVAAARRNRTAWVVHLRGGRCRAVLHIDARAGSLQSARITW